MSKKPSEGGVKILPSASSKGKAPQQKTSGISYVPAALANSQAVISPATASAPSTPSEYPAVVYHLSQEKIYHHQHSVRCPVFISVVFTWLTRWFRFV